MPVILFFTLLFFIFAATTTGTTVVSPVNLILTLKSKHITYVHLVSQNPQLISQFSNTNISLLLTIPNSLIPSFSYDTSATSTWFSSHVIPFLPDVRISAISVRNNVTNAHLLKLLVIVVDNVIEKINELGIHRVKVSTTVSFSAVAKGLLGSLAENGATSFFVSMGSNRSVPEDFGWFKVLGGYVRVISDSELLVYKSLDNGEMNDYGTIVETRVWRVEYMGIVMMFFAVSLTFLDAYKFIKQYRY